MLHQCRVHSNNFSMNRVLESLVGVGPRLRLAAGVSAGVGGVDSGSLSVLCTVPARPFTSAACAAMGGDGERASAVRREYLPTFDESGAAFELFALSSRSVASIFSSRVPAAGTGHGAKRRPNLDCNASGGTNDETATRPDRPRDPCSRVYVDVLGAILASATSRLLRVRCTS